MLKWTLRNPPDAPTPPPPEVTFRAHEGEGRVNLKDSNTCWLETQVKVAQVRSTSKVIENGEGENGKENEGLLQKWRSAHQHHHHHHHHHEEKKRRRKQHKHTRCNPLDPLRLFTGEVTDSDSGSVYMRLEHTPAALLPRPPITPTTGPADPRRKPLIDLSNGDYSDVRKYLQSLSTSSLHPHYPHHHYHHHYHPHPHPHPHQHAHHLPPYLQPFARSTKGSFQRGPGPGPLVRPDPLGASASKLQEEHRSRVPATSRTRSRSSSVSRARPPGPSSHPGVAAGSEGRGAGAGVPSPLKRHSIADIPSAACGVLRGVWEAQKERRGRSVSHDRRRRSRDLKKEGEEEEKDGQRMEGRKARRERRKEEPIYEKVGGESSPSTAANSGSSLASKNSRTSYDNVIYMSMKDLRAQYTQEGEEGERSGEAGFSSPPLPAICHGVCLTPPKDPLYENLLYLPMTEVRSSGKKGLDRQRPLPVPPLCEEQDDTCSFTAEPQRDLHRPVALRFLGSPHCSALHLADQPSKKPCVTDSQAGPPHRTAPEGSAAHRSTGQHVHIDYSEASREPAMPLHQLRPPPPPPPRGTRAGQGTRKSRTKMPSWQRPEPLLPVIYENTRREETPRAAKKRKLRHLMEIEFSIDDDDDERPGGGTSEVSPRGGSQSSSDIPDSGVSEGLTTPLISPLSGPRSPQSPRSDSLLGEPSTPLSLDQLEGKAGPTENTTPDVPRPRLPHDVTDPGFLECERRGYLSEELQEEAPSSWRCGGRSWVDASPISRGDVSRMLLSAVGRNLFCDSPAEGSPARDSSLGRRHSLGSLADLSRKLSFLGLGDNSTTHGKEASVSREAPLKKAHSVLCLSPTSPVRCTAASISASTSSVPLMAAVAQILKEPEARGSPPCRRWLPADGQTAQNTSVQSGQWWAGGAGEAGEERCATKGSGSAGGQAARPSLSCQPSPRYHHPSCPLSPSQSHPALQTISSNPTLPLPVEMSGGQPLAAGHAGAGLSVPVGPRPEKEAVLATQDVSECDSGCGGDLTPRWDQTSARQRRRREESHYRLQRMLEECPCSLRHGEAEESVSADWSMEAVPDEVSTRDPCDLEAEGSDAVPSPSSLPSPPSPDAVSLCTIDSDYGDGIYVSPRLVEQLRRLTEAKMLARLRKSFRGKKEKRPSENVPTKTSGAPKVGIFMFVDNPMYLSPEVKKEARVVSAHASDKSKSAWYVGNPMYTSPEPHRRDSVPEERQRALCEKENLRNARLANVVRQNPTGRKPLANLWLQSNPCYESPEAKASTAEDDTYLTPIAVRRPATLADDPNILDVQKFLDHEYCTIPGDDSDSWVTHSSGSRDSDSPAARRSLAFGAPRRDPTTPSRIWRETGKNQHSTPRKPQGSLEKGATLGTRQHRTPRAVKRGRRGVSQEEPRGASPPPLPARPHPPLHPITHDTSLPANTFEDTSDFHHHRPADPREDTAHFQLPPDGIYESVNRGGRRRVTRSYSDVSSITTSTYRPTRRPSASSPSPSRVRASTCSSGPKNGASGSLCEGSQRGKARRRVGRKYRAGEVLQGKGQLKLAVYENYGLLTIHIMEARKLRSRLSSVCNPYVKISLVPDSQERTFCRTPLLRATNTPHFDQKFSFDFLPEDLDKRLLVSVWSRDTLRKRSEFLGCMSFNVAHICTKRVHGWFRLLTETLGRRKHFAVSFLNASQDSTASSKTKMEEVIVLSDDPAPARVLSTHVTEPVPPIPARNYRLSPQNKLSPRNKKVLGDGTEEFTLDDDTAPPAVPSGASQPQKPPGQTPYTITVLLTRGNEGFGFSVAWTKPPRVERVEEGFPAERAGLRAGDYIIFVSHYNVVKSSEDDVLQMIRECGDVLPLEVYRRGVSKHPRGLVNGYAPSAAPLPPPINDNETHPRKKLSHISFTSENAAEDRQTLVFSIINSEQAFSNACRFGVERYLIPLTFRGDLITTTQHEQLFNNMDQLMDLSETLVDRLMGNTDDAIGDRVGMAYYQLVEELVQQYTQYLAGLPEADQVLALKLQEQDFNEFLHEPPVPRKKPDITSFIHKPAEHLREILGLLTQVYTTSAGHPDNAHLDAVLDRLKSCYRGVTSQQNIMEPSPPAPLPPPTALQTPPPTTTSRPAAPLRPPLISVADIEQRLVFTKFTQPFRLNDGKRQWVFGGELYKFEGRHLKQYWAMLFTDLLLFTKINRDRVIFVMEDPVPLASVCQAIFNVKKKATEFRLIVDIGVRVPGSEAGYLNSPSTTRRRRGSTTSTSSSGRANKRTLVIRAPTIDLKATWNNLINRQLYECQLGASSPLSDYGTSLARAASTDGVPAISPASSRFSSSVGDLRRGGGQEEGVLVVDLGQGRARGPPAASSSSTSCFKSRKLQIRQGEVEEELELADEDDEYSAPLRPSSAPVSPPISAPVSAPVSPPTTAPRVKLTPATPPEFQFVVEHDDPRTAPRSIKPSKAAKVKRGKGGGGRTGGGGRSGGGGRKRGSRPGRSSGGGIVTGPVEEVILNLDSEQPTAAAPLVRGASGDNSALANHHPEDAEVFEDEENEEQYDDEDDEDDGIVIEDDKTGLKSRLAPKKTLGGKVKDKLFPNRHLPKVKKMDRAKKVEKYVDSLVVEDLNHRGRVTPVLPGEDRLTHEDFTRTRNRILQTRPKNFHEGAEEIITLESPPPQRRTEVDLRAEQGARRSEMRLEGIDDVPQRPPVLAQDSFTAPATVLSPEDYEDYIGEPVEKDYPELAGPVEPPRPATPVSPPPSLPPQDSFDYAPQEPVAPEPEEIPQYYCEEPPPAPEPAPLAVEEATPSGPLSGSASMNFMDDHSPTNGLAEGRGLKRYGSSCDIAKLAKGFPEEEAYQQYTQNDYCDDDYNGNFNANHRMSKVGGTGSGPFVAGKLAMFEKVVEEEHQKFIEGQEVRKRIFRAPRKSGEYIEKFYSPQVISSVDARAIDRNQSPPYEDEYDNLDHSRPCTPRDVETPYGGHTSPRRTSTSNYTYRSSDSSNVYTSKPSSPLPRATSPPTKPISPPLTSRLSSPRARSPSPVAKSPSPVARSPSPSGRSSSPSARAPSAAASSNYHDDYDLYPERPMSPTSTLYKAETRQVTPAHGGIRLGSGSEPRTSPDAGRQRLGYQESLEQRTDEVLEMLDMSYLDEAPAPSRHSRSSASPPPAARGREEVTRSSASRSPPPDLSFDQLDDVFDIEEEDVMGSTTSLGQKKRSAPRPPTPPHGAAASPPAEGKLGAFFKGKLGKDSSAPKEKKEKKKDKKDKGKDKEKKEKVKKEEKGATGGAAGGKRFQLFGGAKKASEPQSPTQDSPQASPKKDKGGGKRRLFGRGKENFLGRSPQVQQTSDPQVARMTGGSFDQESISFEDDEYI